MSAEEKEASAFSLVATLGVAGFLAGLFIVGIYQITDPVIKANEAAELHEAVFKVVPGSSQLQALALDNGSVKPLAHGDEAEHVIFAAYDAAGTFKGYAVPAQGPGFQDVIRLIYGFDTSTGKTTGMQVLASKETPGLGDKIIKDQHFVGQFTSRTFDGGELLAAKSGEGTLPQHVDTITGATISSKAVIRIMNETQSLWKDAYPAPGAEPALAAPAEGE
ncbi:MAG: FMN-binding protein [Deltaproteobacteria bacterium]|nr:FMN-binding protein [Deltaproteobacteria bacterium]